MRKAPNSGSKKSEWIILFSSREFFHMYQIFYVPLFIKFIQLKEEYFLYFQYLQTKNSLPNLFSTIVSYAMSILLCINTQKCPHECLYVHVCKHFIFNLHSKCFNAMPSSFSSSVNQKKCVFLSVSYFSLTYIFVF